MSLRKFFANIQSYKYAKYSIIFSFLQFFSHLQEKFTGFSKFAKYRILN